MVSTCPDGNVNCILRLIEGQDDGKRKEDNYSKDNGRPDNTMIIIVCQETCLPGRCFIRQEIGNVSDKNLDLCKKGFTLPK